MTAQSAAEREYFALPTIFQKLSFDASGRPGAKAIRDDQRRLKDKKKALKAQFRRQINSNNLSFRLGFLAQETQANYHTFRHKMYVAKLEAQAYVERDEREGSPRKLLNLDLTAPCPLQMGPWFVIDNRIEHKDYNYYSKKWHNTYGAKITHTYSATFARWYRGKQKRIEVSLDSLSGDWLVRAATKAELITPVKSKYSLKIRLNKHYDAKFVANRRGYKLYRRTLLGSHIDWVIVSPLGVTYHDSDRKQLIKGLRSKITSASNKLKSLTQGLIDWDACRNLGFCKAGISSFCEDFGLDTSERYTPAEVEKAVRSAPQLAAPYMDELRTLARAFDYKISF